MVCVFRCWFNIECQRKCVLEQHLLLLYLKVYAPPPTTPPKMVSKLRK